MAEAAKWLPQNFCKNHTHRASGESLATALMNTKTKNNARKAMRILIPNQPQNHSNRGEPRNRGQHG